MEIDTQTLLIRCLRALGLKKEETKIVISLLRTENQMIMMLDWIENNHEKKPTPTEVTIAAIEILEEIHD